LQNERRSCDVTLCVSEDVKTLFLHWHVDNQGYFTDDNVHFNVCRVCVVDVVDVVERRCVQPSVNVHQTDLPCSLNPHQVHGCVWQSGALSGAHHLYQRYLRRFRHPSHVSKKRTHLQRTHEYPTRNPCVLLQIRGHAGGHVRALPQPIGHEPRRRSEPGRLPRARAVGHDFDQWPFESGGVFVDDRGFGPSRTFVGGRSEMDAMFAARKDQRGRNRLARPVPRLHRAHEHAHERVRHDPANAGRHESIAGLGGTVLLPQNQRHFQCAARHQKGRVDVCQKRGGRAPRVPHVSVVHAAGERVGAEAETARVGTFGAGGFFAHSTNDQRMFDHSGRVERQFAKMLPSLFANDKTVWVAVWGMWCFENAQSVEMLHRGVLFEGLVSGWWVVVGGGVVVVTDFLFLFVWSQSTKQF
jgi:hypothetical protein